MEKIEIALAPLKSLEDASLIDAARNLNHDLRELQATMLQVATSTAHVLAHRDRVRVNEDFRKIDANVRAMTDKLKEAVVSLEQSADERRRVLAPDQAAMLLKLGKDPRTGQSREIIPRADIVEVFKGRGQFAQHDATRLAMDLEVKGYVEPLTSSEYRLTGKGILPSKPVPSAHYALRGL